MSNLKELRNRLRSLHTTHKITASMKVVSSTKFRKLQRISLHQFAFLEAMGSNLERFISQQYNQESTRMLLFVFAGDRGLCGSYNQNIQKRLRSLTDTYNEIILVGKRLSVKSDTVSLHLRMHDACLPSAWQNIDQLCYDFGTIDLLYTQFNSTTDQQVILQRIRSNEPQEKPFFINETTKDCTKAILTAHVLTATLHAQLCEFSSRMISMDNACHNADTMIKDLHLHINKLRQSTITRELSETVAGAQL